jgi:enediyne biosynthesis protein E4
VGDLDNNGKEEIAIVNMGEAPSLLKNFAPVEGNSVVIRAVTAKRDAVGARVAVIAGGRKQVDEVRSGGSFISQNDFRLHFGLGKATLADVVIRWQDGKLENIPGVAANQVVTIEEGHGVSRQDPYNDGKK